MSTEQSQVAKPVRRSRLLPYLLLALSPNALAQDISFSFDSALHSEAAAGSCSAMPGPDAPEGAVSQPVGLSVILLGAPGQKRLFGVIPNYRADQLQEIYKPLSTRQKYRIARSDSFDWPNYILLAGYAVQAQVASGGFGHNGGAGGFAKSYARSVGDQIIGSYITEAILPGLLHEDPRFFRLGSGSLLRRTSYAASRVFIARRDDGRSSFNISEIAGNVGVVALTSAYYPNNRSFSEGVERFGMQVGNDMISNLLTEFWPDIKRHLPFQHRTSVRR